MVAPPCLHGHGLLIRLADAVLQCQPSVILRPLLRSHFRKSHTRQRRHHVKVQLPRQRLAVQHHRYLLVFSETHLPYGILSIFRHPQQHVAQACRQKRAACRVGCFLSHGVEFSIIVKFELHQRIADRLAGSIRHPHLQRGCWGVVFHHIDFRVAGSAAHHLLRSVVVAKHLCMHEHAP